MMHGADAAEQMVRLSLEGMEVVLRDSGTGAKNLAVLLATAIREEKQTIGKTSLTSLIMMLWAEWQTCHTTRIPTLLKATAMNTIRTTIS